MCDVCWLFNYIFYHFAWLLWKDLTPVCLSRQKEISLFAGRYRWGLWGINNNNNKKKPITAESWVFPASSNLRLWDFPVFSLPFNAPLSYRTARFYFPYLCTLILTQKDNYWKFQGPVNLWHPHGRQSKSDACIMQTSILSEIFWDQKVTGEWGANKVLWSYFCS